MVDERIVERELFGGEYILVGETLLCWRVPPAVTGREAANNAGYIPVPSTR